MKIAIPDKEKFLTSFLTPLSRISDQAVFTIQDNKFIAVVGAPDGALFLHSEFSPEGQLENNTLNFPSLSKLIKVLNCVPDNSITLDLVNNHLQYKSDTVKFKYHLLDDGVIRAPSISIAKVLAQKFKIGFELTSQNAQTLIKGAGFASDTDKIYFRCQNGAVYAELTDKKKNNTDSIEYKVCDEYTGDPLDSPLSLGFESFRNVFSSKFDKYQIQIAEQGVFLFRASSDNIQVSYVVAAFAE